MSFSTTIQKILDGAKNMDHPVFRGQAVANWKLESGIIRRLKLTYDDSLLSDEKNCLKLVKDHQAELLSRQKIIGTEHTTDEKILSELQHHGAATQLLDFTKDPAVALWFACSDQKNSTVDGKLFIIDIGNLSYFTNGRELKWLEDPPQRYVYYEPELSLSNRILIQKSIFIVCSPYISENICEVITIPANDKANICQELELMGISEDELFPDLPGLAECNRCWKPFKQKPFKISDPIILRREGNKAYRNKLFQIALSNYQKIVDLDPGNFEAHWLVGNACAELKDYKEAIAYYTKAINLIGQAPGYLEPWAIHYDLGTYFFNQGNAYATLGEQKEAIEGFHQGLKNIAVVKKISEGQHDLVQRLERDTLYNRANSQYLSQQYSDAIESFTKAGGENRSDTCLGMGNAYLKNEVFKKAQEYYRIGQKREPKAQAEQCATNASMLLIYLSRSNRSSSFQFIGNRGNFGNWGGETGVGGAGYPGLNGPVLNGESRTSKPKG